jgi:DNA-binding CsgD family transcriptional regulator
LTDDAGDAERQDLAISDSGEVKSPVASIFESPMLGMAICDAQLRYVSVNNALAVMNGIPPEAHIGKTVREVIGNVGSAVELMLRSVFVTGQSVLNAEIMGRLPARNSDGYWIENYFPIRESTGTVRQVGVLVIEITGLRRLENCILALMGNPPRTRGQFTPLGKPYGLEKESVELWSGSIDMAERSVRDTLRNYHQLQEAAQVPMLREVVTQQPVRLPSDETALPNKSSRQTHPSIPIGADSSKPLSPREIEIVRCLAIGKGNKEIATALGIAVKTVETHRAKIFLKLQIHSVVDLVLYAVRHGLVKA